MGDTKLDKPYKSPQIPLPSLPSPGQHFNLTLRSPTCVPGWGGGGRTGATVHPQNPKQGKETTSVGETGFSFSNSLIINSLIIYE